MIMPGVLQWHVPSKLFMWQKPKGYLSTWTWRNTYQPSTRKYQVLGHPCCRTEHDETFARYSGGWVILGILLIHGDVRKRSEKYRGSIKHIW